LKSPAGKFNKPQSGSNPESRSMAYVSDNDDEFAVFDREAITNLLLGMAQKNVPVNATFNGGKDVLLTVVLDVDQKTNSVYLDVNANEEFNKQIVAAKRVGFHAFFNGAKIMWTVAGLYDSKYEGTPAFKVEIPERLQRIQRRGSFRVATPIMNPVMCKIPLGNKQEVNLPLFDICIEGLGLVMPATPIPGFEKMKEYRDCKLEHPDLGVLEVSLFVKSIWEMTLKNGQPGQRAGLEFTHIKQATQTAIQRFVYKMERQMMATTRGA
jgi:c-di-GMP-binding flagellar brake protein YcgR